jgi:hypothetical protein
MFGSPFVGITEAQECNFIRQGIATFLEESAADDGMFRHRQ